MVGQTMVRKAMIRQTDQSLSCALIWGWGDVPAVHGRDRGV